MDISRTLKTGSCTCSRISSTSYSAATRWALALSRKLCRSLEQATRMRSDGCCSALVHAQLCGVDLGLMTSTSSQTLCNSLAVFACQASRRTASGLRDWKIHCIRSDTLYTNQNDISTRICYIAAIQRLPGLQSPMRKGK